MIDAAFLDFINSVRELTKEHERKLYRLQELAAAATRTTPNWSADGGHGGDSQKLWAAFADELDEVSATQEEIDRHKAKLEAVICQVDGKLARRILRLRYVRCWPWPRICAAIPKSDRQIYRMHRDGLAAAEAIWRELREENYL